MITGSQLFRQLRLYQFVFIPAKFIASSFLTVDTKYYGVTSRIEFKRSMQANFIADQIESCRFDVKRLSQEERLFPRHAVPISVLFAISKLATRDLLSRCDPRRLGNCLLHNALGGSQIFLHQQRRKAERVAHIVEAESGIVRREYQRGIKVNAHQVGDSIPILRSIQSASHIRAGINFFRINSKGTELDPSH